MRDLADGQIDRFPIFGLVCTIFECEYQMQPGYDDVSHYVAMNDPLGSSSSESSLSHSPITPPQLRLTKDMQQGQNTLCFQCKWKEILGLSDMMSYRSKRSLLVPPMFVPENQRAPFPRLIGKSHVISSDMKEDHIFRLIGRGADQDPKGVFSINRLTGEVAVSRALDREAIAYYHLQVSTTDLSGRLVEGPVDLDVSVIDQNDNRPVFKEPRYSGEVLEGSPTGTTVMTMTAYDADDPNTDNAVLRYIIVRQLPDKPSPNMFYIDPERGDIVTVIAPHQLDRETLPTTQYELEIVAKDMAGSEVGLTGTATATITITDRNDHAPEFTHSLFQASVNEGSTGVVVNLTVDDRDDPATGAWRAIYSIINGDPNQNFEIQTNLDNNEGMLSVVKVRSPPASGTGTLKITLEDENDNAPYVFPSVARVCEDAKDMNVVVIGGRDKDIHPNTDPFKIELGKQPGLEKTWKISRINDTHSQIMLLHSLKKANYNLPLVLTDSGIPPISNNTELKVQVCTCRKNRMDCSRASSIQTNLLLLLGLVLLSILCL
ncbi:cadherin-13-like [Sinocyclocheilus grahami]|uniref:cadherin-13-like n=1 Tax=Sinocyclocheilus grahami TaxID=75366 RepID=UPI0007AD2B2E|nr:PREDICTED: cadherin-13-like [Sinocyclocheilus grahami]